MFDLFPDSPAVIADFFITDQQHYEALYYPIRAGEITVQDLDRVLDDPEAITKLVNRSPSNPHKGIVFGFGKSEMGLHTQEEQIQAVDMAADSLARGLDAATAHNLFGLATEVGYLRALADLAIAEGVEGLATIAKQNAAVLIARFEKIYGEIG